jgi:hypothetical protein
MMRARQDRHIASEGQSYCVFYAAAAQQRQNTLRQCRTRHQLLLKAGSAINRHASGMHVHVPDYQPIREACRSQPEWSLMQQEQAAILPCPTLSLAANRGPGSSCRKLIWQE